MARQNEASQFVLNSPDGSRLHAAYTYSTQIVDNPTRGENLEIQKTNY